MTTNMFAALKYHWTLPTVHKIITASYLRIAGTHPQPGINASGYLLPVLSVHMDIMLSLTADT